MSRWGLLGIVVVVALPVLTSPAAAGWRDYRGKTMIVEVERTREVKSTVIELVDAELPSVLENGIRTCRETWFYYVSSRDRLFTVIPRSECFGNLEQPMKVPTGQVVDLLTGEDVTPNRNRLGAVDLVVPTRLLEREEQLVLMTSTGEGTSTVDGIVATFSNTSGENKTILTFAESCRAEIEGDTSLRMDIRLAEGGDARILIDIEATTTMKTVSCRFADGFVGQ